MTNDGKAMGWLIGNPTSSQKVSNEKDTSEPFWDPDRASHEEAARQTANSDDRKLRRIDIAKMTIHYASMGLCMLIITVAGLHLAAAFSCDKYAIDSLDPSLINVILAGIFSLITLCIGFIAGGYDKE